MNRRDQKMRLEALRERLHAEFDELAGRLSEASETESVSALSAYDNHPADLATDTFSRELDVGLRLRLERRLQHVSDAEQAWVDGTYGICQSCHREISPDRLQAVPDAVMCQECQSEADLPYQPPPSEALVAPMPFGVVPPPSAVEVDGKDIWQDLAAWGTSDSPQDVPPAIDYEQTYVDFEQPEGYVELVETLIDENGEPLLENARELALREARRTEPESAEY